MSDTMQDDEQDAAPAPPPVQNVKVSVREVKVSGTARERIAATWGAPARTIEVQRLTMGEQFDLAAITGRHGDNPLWLNMATAAASVHSFDDVPAPPLSVGRPSVYLDDLRSRLDKLGQDGVLVTLMVLNGYRGADMPKPEPAVTQEEHRAAVGNSAGTALSPNA